MNDDELRGLIRAAIQRHVGVSPSQQPAPPKLATIHASEGGMSFGQYHLARSDDETACLIEPAVQCNHCGFCQCHGH